MKYETQRLAFRVMSVTLCLCGLFLSASLFFASVPLAAQQKLLTLDDIYGPTSRVNFSGAPAPAVTWIDDGHYTWARPSGEGRGGVDWVNVVASTGGAAPLFDAPDAEESLTKVAGIGADEARRLVHSRELSFNRTYTAATFTLRDDLYFVSFKERRAARLTSTAGEEREPAFSPDGSKVAF